MQYKRVSRDREIEKLLYGFSTDPAAIELMNRYEVLTEVYTPDLASRAIYAAGLFLRHNPDHVLDQVDLRVSSNDANQLALCALQSIVRSSSERVESHKGYSLHSKQPGRIRHHCKESEGRFLWAIQRAYTDADLEYRLPPAAISVLDRNGETVLFGKSNGSPLYLAFEDIVIDGVQYPAGSIVSLEFDREDLERLTDPSDSTHAEISIDRVESAAFLRISRFAISQQEQVKGGWGTACVPPEYSKRIHGMNVDDVRREVAATTCTVTRYSVQ